MTDLLMLLLCDLLILVSTLLYMMHFYCTAGTQHELLERFLKWKKLNDETPNTLTDLKQAPELKTDRTDMNNLEFWFGMDT